MTLTVHVLADSRVLAVFNSCYGQGLKVLLKKYLGLPTAPSYNPIRFG